MTGVGTDTLLREWGALLEGDHFVYISGQHGSAWIGLILAQWLAHHLRVLAAFGEHEDTPPDGDLSTRRPFTLKRGYDRLVAGRNVLVVDDVVNTGFSIRGMIDVVRRNGGIVEKAATAVPVNTAYAHGAGSLAAGGRWP